MLLQPPKIEPNTLVFPSWALWLSEVRRALPTAAQPQTYLPPAPSPDDLPLVHFCSQTRQWQIYAQAWLGESTEGYGSTIAIDYPVVRIQRTCRPAAHVNQSAEQAQHNRRLLRFEQVLKDCRVPFDAFGLSSYQFRLHDNLTISATRSDRLVRSTPTRESGALRALRSAVFLHDTEAVVDVLRAYPKLLQMVNAAERVSLAAAACLSSNAEPVLHILNRHGFIFHSGITDAVRRLFTNDDDSTAIASGTAALRVLEDRLRKSREITRLPTRSLLRTPIHADRIPDTV